MDGFTDADLLGALIGIAMPVLLKKLTSAPWGDEVKAGLAYLAYFLVTLVTMWFLNQFVMPVDARAGVRLFLFIAVTAYGSFKLAWKPLGVVKGDSFGSGHVVGSAARPPRRQG